MSVISETEPGGEMVCILKFSARPRNPENSPVSGERRAFLIGQRVRFLTSFVEATPQDNPIGPMAVFQPLDSRDDIRYAATEGYFVTLACWEGLRRHFASNLAVTRRAHPDTTADHRAPYVVTGEIVKTRRERKPAIREGKGQGDLMNKKAKPDTT